MKKILLVTVMFCLAILSNAQVKVFQTKAGKIKFFSSTAVEDIEAVNNQVDAKLATNGQVVFMLNIKGFKFDNSLMQEHFNGEGYMESDKYPKSVFKGNITDLKAVDFTKDGVYKVSVKGTLEIHGVTKDLTTTGTIEIKGGKVTSKSNFKVKLADFKIKGHEKVAKEIDVTVECKYN